MCVPLCEQMLKQTQAELAKQPKMSRRGLIKGAGALGVAAAAAAATVTHAAPITAASSQDTASNLVNVKKATRVVDLTHRLHMWFPTFSGVQQLLIQQFAFLDKDGYNDNRYHLSDEHTGTHMDAPFHFGKGPSADQIPVENLVGALCVIDIRDKAAKSADALLTVDDIAAYEKKHGKIQRGSIVAMNSGWDAFVDGPKFRNADDKGVMHFPGFHVDAASALIERGVNGIMVDTLSLDYGISQDFATHYKWLPSNRWGIECCANLGQLPASGSTVIVGGPKMAGATGGPSRVIALA